MAKTTYESPLTRIIEVRTYGFLQGSVEKMNSIQGSWDEEE